MDMIPSSLSMSSFCKNLYQLTFQCVYCHGTLLFNWWARVQCVLSGKDQSVAITAHSCCHLFTKYPLQMDF